MMSDYLIVTDSTTDLPDSYCREHNLKRMYLSCLLEGKTYNDENPLPEDEFYRKVRGGAMPTSSQVNPEQAKEKFLSWLQEKSKILCISFSSGLSGTYASCVSAAKEVMEENPGCEIAVVDSLCASLGEGLLVHKALMMQQQGCSFEEVTNWVTRHRLNVVHNFTVDDLFHLHRGGRVSRTIAILGTMINIKPVLHVDDEGHLINVDKVRGRKKSIQALANAMEKQIGSWRDQNDIVFISHGDCLEDAEYLKQLVSEKFGITNFLIHYVGPVIGTHSGPGTLALFYMGDVR